MSMLMFVILSISNLRNSTAEKYMRNTGIKHLQKSYLTFISLDQQKLTNFGLIFIVMYL